MNEQIKQFSEQAINYATSKRPLPDLKDKELFLNNLFEKFAELIVRECAKVASVETSDNGVGEVIREHFGVEE